MFEVGKTYKTRNGSTVRCVTDGVFKVIDGGHGLTDYDGTCNEEEYCTNAAGEIEVSYTTGIEKIIDELHGMDVMEDQTVIDGMEKWRVTLHEDKGDKGFIHFDCHAEDAEHAMEQADNAYPNGEVLHAVKVSDIEGGTPTFDIGKLYATKNGSLVYLHQTEEVAGIKLMHFRVVNGGHHIQPADGADVGELYTTDGDGVFMGDGYNGEPICDAYHGMDITGYAQSVETSPDPMAQMDGGIRVEPALTITVEESNSLLKFESAMEVVIAARDEMAEELKQRLANGGLDKDSLEDVMTNFVCNGCRLECGSCPIHTLLDDLQDDDDGTADADDDDGIQDYSNSTNEVDDQIRIMRRRLCDNCTNGRTEDGKYGGCKLQGADCWVWMLLDVKQTFADAAKIVAIDRAARTPKCVEYLQKACIYHDVMTTVNRQGKYDVVLTCQSCGLRHAVRDADEKVPPTLCCPTCKGLPVSEGNEPGWFEKGRKA